MVYKVIKTYLSTVAISGVLLLATASTDFGQTKTAADSFQEAVYLCEDKDRELQRREHLESMRRLLSLREPEKAVSSTLRIADCHRQALRFQDALYYYKLVLDVKPSSGLAKAKAYNSIAQVYTYLYQYELALYYHDKAFKQALEVKHLPAQVVALTGLANLFYRLGDGKQAIAYSTKARQLTRLSIGQEAGAALLLLIAQIDQDGGMEEKARITLEEALIIYRRMNNTEGQIKVLCAMSNLNLLSGQKSMALSNAEQAVKLAERQAELAELNADKLKAREVRWLASLSQARAQRALGQKDPARKSYLRAIHQFEGSWLSFYISTEKSAVAFREERQAPYRELVDLLIDQGDFKQAFEWAERTKGRAILRLIEARRLTNAARKEQQEGAVRDLQHSISRLRTQLFSPEISSKQRTELQSRLREAELAIEEAQVETEMERSRKRSVWSQPTTVKTLQEQMSKGNETLLEFFVGENRSFVWCFTSGDLYFEILPGREEIEKVVRQCSDLFTVSPSNMYVERDISKLKARTEELFLMLLGKLSRRVGLGKRLVVVPDGLLHYLPFEALTHNERYLVEDHEISYIQSASMLGLWQDFRGELDGEDKMELLAFGDPVFELAPKAVNGKKARRDFNNAAQTLRLSQGFSLARLPRTHDEIEFIASLYPPEQRKVYLGKESSEDAVMRESLRRYKRLHFATHSLIDEKRPSRSAVVLTLDEDPKEDGFLELSEIAALDLDSDLVVLSSCQTGRGQLLSAEGIIGLSRAFLRAGARSVVVSLWNVNDISTGRLMKSFYQRTADNISNVAALREAKLQMLKSGRETRHPYYWAPFIIIGKP